MSYLGACFRDSAGHVTFSSFAAPLMFNWYDGYVDTALVQTGMILRVGYHLFDTDFYAGYASLPHICAIRPGTSYYSAPGCLLKYGSRVDIYLYTASGADRVDYRMIIKGCPLESPIEEHGLYLNTLYWPSIFGAKDYPPAVIASISDESITISSTLGFTYKDITVVNATTNYFAFANGMEIFTPPVATSLSYSMYNPVGYGFCRYRTGTGARRMAYLLLMMKRVNATTMRVIPVAVKTGSVTAPLTNDIYYNTVPSGFTWNFKLVEFSA